MANPGTSMANATSSVCGNGWGSSHRWKGEPRWDSTPERRCIRYTCQICGVGFVHNYVVERDIFMAIRGSSVPNICGGSVPSTEPVQALDAEPATVAESTRVANRHFAAWWSVTAKNNLPCVAAQGAPPISVALRDDTVMVGRIPKRQRDPSSYPFVCDTKSDELD
jgi:hypothetical protein